MEKSRQRTCRPRARGGLVRSGPRRSGSDRRASFSAHPRAAHQLPDAAQRDAHHNNRPLAWAKSVYAPVLDQSLRHLRSILAIALAAFAASWLLAFSPGSEFLSEFDAGSIWANLRLPASVSNSRLCACSIRSAPLFCRALRCVPRSPGRGSPGTNRPQETPRHPNTIQDNPTQSKTAQENQRS
jgi:hypothetical protein